MNHFQLSERIDESDWLLPRLSGYGSVTSVVPDGFPAYLRILHPARSRSGAPVRWAEIAAWSGRKMHRLAEFHRIADPLPAFGHEPQPWDEQEPDTCNLAPDLMRVLCTTLREYTATSDACWFCVWHGYGWLRGSTAPSVSLPGREYLLFEGPLTAAMNIDWSPGGSIFCRQSPNLFWPQDHAWCVASEIDLYATLVGGPQSLADALVANPALEAWRVEPTDPVTSDGDRINM